MDKFSQIAKGGWHPSGDRPIRKESWKSDLKSMAGRKKDDSLDRHNHQSAPLSSLKDPDSFGPPPKHYPNGVPPPAPVASSSSTAVSKPQTYRAPSPPRGGLGSVVPTPPKRREAEAEEESAPKPPPVPYRVDTSGLRTDHLPAPPRRGHGESNPVVAAQPRAPVAPKKAPVAPPRTQPGPPPVLPPRQNEYPDEHTPAPPPPYQEAAQQPNAASGFISGQATARLGQAGVSVPGFNIGSQQQSTGSANPVAGAQVSELQKRFARMKTGAEGNPAIANVGSSVLAAAAAHKKPPPPPPKKSEVAAIPPQPPAVNGSQPPPLPLSSKPRPS